MSANANVCVFPSPVTIMADYIEVVQRRTFRVSSMDEVPAILRGLQREGFVGSVKISVGRGGVPSAIEAEEKHGLDKD